MRDREILRRVPPELQALLSKTQNELAKERKYKSMLYPITIEELERVDTSEFYVVVGTSENHVCTKWALDGDEQAFLTLYVEFSTFVEEGELTKQNSDSFPTTMITEGIDEALELAEYFTRYAFDKQTTNDASIDYVLITMDEEKVNEESEVNLFYPIVDLYFIAALRCRKVHIDAKTYAMRCVMESYEQMRTLLLPDELDFNLAYEISRAKYELKE